MVTKAHRPVSKFLDSQVLLRPQISQCRAFKELRTTPPTPAHIGDAEVDLCRNFVQIQKNLDEVKQHGQSDIQNFNDWFDKFDGLILHFSFELWFLNLIVLLAVPVWMLARSFGLGKLTPIKLPENYILLCAAFMLSQKTGETALTFFWDNHQHHIS